MSFTRISIMVLLAAIVVYFGLTYLFPHQKDAAAVAAGATTDQVFGATTANTPAPASPDTAAVAAAAETPAATTADSPKDAAATPAADSTPAPASTESKDAPAAPTAAPDSATGGVKDEPAKVEPAVAATAEAPASSADSTASTDTSSAPSTGPKSDSKTLTASPPKHHHHGEASTEAVASTATAEPVATTTESTKEKSHERKRRHAETKDDVATAWWPDASKRGSDELSLEYAGEANFAKAIVLLFNFDLGDATAAGGHIHVYSYEGKEVPATWSAGQNARMLVLKVAHNGRYTVVVGPELADASGKSLGARLFGPVYIR